MPQTQPSSKPRTARLDPKVRRELILDAASAVFECRDPAEVTFEEIADAAGVSRALVYNYFGDRGGLLAAVYLQAMEQLIARLNAHIAGDLPPPERMRRIVREYLRFARDHPAGWRLLHVTSVMRHPALVEARRAHVEQLGRWWGASAPARIVAVGVIGLLESATFDWLESRDDEAEHLADVLFDLVWSGLSSLERHGIALPQQRAPDSVPT